VVFLVVSYISLRLLTYIFFICFLVIMSYKKERKSRSESRTSNPGWTYKYLYTFTRDEILCLVCRETLSVPNAYNIRRQFKSKHLDLDYKSNLK